MLVALIFTTLFIFVEFFSTSVVVFFLGEHSYEHTITTVAISYAHNVCSIGSTWLFNQLYQLLLADRTVDRRWSSQRRWTYHNRMGLPHSFGSSVDAANTSNNCMYISTGVTSLARQKTLNRRCHQKHKKVYQRFRQPTFWCTKTVAMMVHAHSLEKETDVSQPLIPSLYSALLVRYQDRQKIWIDCPVEIRRLNSIVNNLSNNLATVLDVFKSYLEMQRTKLIFQNWWKCMPGRLRQRLLENEMTLILLWV
jgi:hypothetical protein